MKKFLLSFLLLGLVISAQSQNPINLNFGGNASFLGGKELDKINSSTSLKPGFFIGISIDDNISDFLVVETGFDYTVKSYELSPKLEYTSQFARVYVFGRIYKKDLFFLFGPELNVNLYTNLSALSENYNITNNTQIATFGPSGGIGHRIGNKSSVFVKYHHNFLGFFADNSKLYSRTIDLGIKYVIKN